MSLTSLMSRILNGLESFQLETGAGGGEGFYTSSSQMTNTTRGLTLSNAATGTIVWPSGAGLLNLISTVIFLVASTSATFQLPATPMDGQLVELVNGSGGAFTQMTIATTDGATIVGGNTTGALANGASVQYMYILATNSWYKMR